MKNSTRIGEPEAVAVQIADEPVNVIPLAIFIETVLPETGGSGGGDVDVTLTVAVWLADPPGPVQDNE